MNGAIKPTSILMLTQSEELLLPSLILLVICVTAC